MTVEEGGQVPCKGQEGVGRKWDIENQEHRGGNFMLMTKSVHGCGKIMEVL